MGRVWWRHSLGITLTFSVALLGEAKWKGVPTPGRWVSGNILWQVDYELSQYWISQKHMLVISSLHSAYLITRYLMSVGQDPSPSRCPSIEFQKICGQNNHMHYWLAPKIGNAVPNFQPLRQKFHFNKLTTKQNKKLLNLQLKKILLVNNYVVLLSLKMARKAEGVISIGRLSVWRFVPIPYKWIVKNIAGLDAHILRILSQSNFLVFPCQRKAFVLLSLAYGVHIYCLWHSPSFLYLESHIEFLPLNFVSNSSLLLLEVSHINFW